VVPPSEVLIRTIFLEMAKSMASIPLVWLAFIKDPGLDAIHWQKFREVVFEGKLAFHISSLDVILIKTDYWALDLAKNSNPVFNLFC